MRFDDFDKLFQNKVEEAQSSGIEDSSWNKEAAWSRIQTMSSPAFSEKKKISRRFYAAAVICPVLLTAGLVIKLFPGNYFNTKNLLSTTEQIDLPTTKNLAKNNIQELTGLNRSAPQNKIDITVKKPVNIGAQKPKPKTLLPVKIAVNGSPNVTIASSQIVADSVGYPVADTLSPTVSPIAPPVKVKIVLGETTTNKIENLAATDDNTNLKSSKKFLSGSSKADKKKTSKKLTAIQRDKNPLSLNHKIEL